jgi:hypothetical protein
MLSWSANATRCWTAARVADAIPLLAADAPDSLLSGRAVEIGSDGWPPSALLRCDYSPLRQIRWDFLSPSAAISGLSENPGIELPASLR